MKEDASCPLCHVAGIHVRTLRELLHGSGEEFGQRVCKGCGTYFLSPRIRESDIDRYYPQDYQGYLPNTHPRWIRAITSMLGLTQRRCRMIERYIGGGRLLDVGVGNGFFLKNLSPQKWERSGMDAMWNPHLWDKNEISFHEGKFDGDLLSLDPFDAITLWHVFEHFYHPQQALTNAYRLLKPGGYLFIIVPDLKNLDRHLFGRYWVGWDAPRHIAIYSRYALETLLSRSGFEVRAVCPSLYTGDYFLLNLEFIQRGANRKRWPLAQSLFLRILLSPFLWALARIGLAPIKMYVAQKRN